MNLANLLQEQGRLPEAISHYQYTVEVAPRGFIFHYNYGLGLARNNRERDALPELEKAVELAPDHSGARYALGLALINTGQRERALPHLHRARDLATAQKQEALLKQINDLLGGK
jgi:tetratricopeptide (TPR) repeat protein